MLCSLSTLHVQWPSHEVLSLVSLSEAVEILLTGNALLLTQHVLSTEVALPLPLVSGVADKLTEVESLMIIIVGS